ncbi:MAG: hypothetical protein IPG81_07200 [Sandaracinaceae bacterium]|nr:hypothetical protein [Sandaracinaceae bacterium]
MQATAARWLTLSFGASMLLAGCSGDARSPIIDGGGVPGSCEVDNGGCSITPMVACGTSDRGVVCGACPSDYRGDGRVCTSLIRVDECARGSDNCAATAMCVNTPGAYICTCHRGFAGNGVTCAHVGCEAAADCDDDVACTVDSCSASGSCLHAPTSALCGAETSCNPVSGCVAGAACSSPADCADSDPCTLETCNASTGTCEFQVADSDQDGEVPWVWWHGLQRRRRRRRLEPPRDLRQPGGRRLRRRRGQRRDASLRPVDAPELGVSLRSVRASLRAGGDLQPGRVPRVSEHTGRTVLRGGVRLDRHVQRHWRSVSVSHRHAPCPLRRGGRGGRHRGP